MPNDPHRTVINSGPQNARPLAATASSIHIVPFYYSGPVVAGTKSGYWIVPFALSVTRMIVSRTAGIPGDVGVRIVHNDVVVSGTNVFMGGDAADVVLDPPLAVAEWDYLQVEVYSVDNANTMGLTAQLILQ